MTDDRRDRILSNVTNALIRAGGQKALDSVVFRLPEPAEVASVDGVMSGDPVVVGTRVLAESVVAEIIAGATPLDIVRTHPTLTTDAVAAVIEWHHANGGDDLWQTPAGQAILRWRQTTAVNTKVAQALLDLHFVETMIALVHGGAVGVFDVDGDWRFPRRDLLILKKRIDAVAPVVGDSSLDVVGGPGIEAVIAWERRRWQDLVTDDDGTPALFEALARMSALVAGEDFLPRWDANSAFTPPNTQPIPFDLLIGWDRYGRRWETFKQRNPRVMIASLMSQISESHDHSSFPFGWEGKIKAWVDDGMPAPYPFDNRNGISLETLWMDLSDAIVLAGPGWVEDRGDGRTGVELKWVQP